MARRFRFSASVRLAVGAAIALAGLALVASPASAAVGSTTTVTESTGAATGAPVTFTATVTHGSGVPTGTVTFTVTGASSTPYTCDGGDVSNLGPNGSGPGSVATCSFSGGLQASDSPYAVTAAYSGDGTYNPSNGDLSGVIHKGHTTTSLISASNPTVTGQSVDFTATVGVLSPATGTPTGSVTFAINGTGGGSVACDSGDSVPLTGNMASCSVAAGLLAQFSPYTVTATYSGDSNFVTSNHSITQTVSKQTATIAVTSSVPGQLFNGQAVTFTATVTPSGSGTPTGNVVFTVVNTNGVAQQTCDGGNTQPLVGTSATCTFAAGLPAKPLSYTVTATLQDPNYSTPIAGSLDQLMVKASTTTTLSAVQTSLVAGQTFSFKVTIQTQSPATGVPQGTLEWAVCNYHASQCSGNDAPAGGTVTLPTPTNKDIANNQQQFTISVPGGVTPPAFYYLSATFWGASNYQSSASSNTYMTVGKVPTSMNLVGSSNPVRTGNRLVIRASIISNTEASPSIGAPTGTVTFSIVGTSDDNLTCDTGSNVVTISTTNQNQGFASCTIPLGVLMPADAPYEVQAHYSGDQNYDSVNASMAVVVKNT